MQIINEKTTSIFLFQFIIFSVLFPAKFFISQVPGEINGQLTSTTFLVIRRADELQTQAQQGVTAVASLPFSGPGGFQAYPPSQYKNEKMLQEMPGQIWRFIEKNLKIKRRKQLKNNNLNQEKINFYLSVESVPQ